MKDDYKKRNKVNRRPILDERKRALFTAQLLRNSQVFSRFCDIIEPDHFLPDHAFVVLWQMLKSYHAIHHVLPEIEMIRAEIEGAIAVNSSILQPEELSRLDDFFEFAYAPSTFIGGPESERYTAWSLHTGQQFLEEKIARKLSDAMAQQGGTVLSNLPDVMQQAALLASQAMAVGTPSVNVAFPDGWDKNVAIGLVKTEFDFIDPLLGGGQAPGEVYGMLGPFGSCKSTVAYMLAGRAARQFQRLRTEQPDSKPKFAVIISYEDNVKVMRLRTLSYVGKISRNTLESMESFSQLSTAKDEKTLKDYERKKFSSTWEANGCKVGEQERAADAIFTLNKHLVLLDMISNMGMGGGSINEIASLIDAQCRQRDADCGLIVLDYVGAMVERYMSAHELDQHELRLEIKRVPFKAKTFLAARFNCPVWLMHQLSGAANEFGTGKLAHHTDSAESKSFAENLDFSFSISKPDSDSRALFGCTKYRRWRAEVNRVIQVEGGWSDVSDVSHKYVLDKGKIVPVGFQKSVATFGNNGSGAPSNDPQTVPVDTTSTPPVDDFEIDPQ